MPTKAELQDALTEAGINFEPKATKAELEHLLEQVETRKELDALMGAERVEEPVEAEVPEETPAPEPAKAKLVKVVADKGVTMSGTLFAHGLRLTFINNVAWVPEDVAEVLRVREKNTCTVTDETRDVG